MRNRDTKPEQTPPALAPPATDNGSRASSAPMSLGRIFDWLAAVVPLTAIAAALAFWFGWQYTSERGRYLGVEVSVMELTPNDFVLRSADALIVPATVTSVAVLLWLTIHGVLVYGVHAGKGVRWIGVGAWALIVIGIAGLIASVLWMFNGFPAGYDYRAPPLALGLSAGLVAEGASLLRNTGSAYPPRLASWQRGGYIMLTSLVIISLFWVFSLWAGSLGRGRAVVLEENQARLSAVIVYSDHPLGLQAPVVETVIAGPEGAYHYRYSGLRFLQRAADKYFLWPFQWDHRVGGTIVLPDGPGIRLEYAPGERVDSE
jgi:hypothetical protein